MSLLVTRPGTVLVFYRVFPNPSTPCGLAVDKESRFVLQSAGAVRLVSQVP